MAVNIKPLEDKILVQANEAETTTASGLVIPDTAKEKPQEGTVVAVGPGRWDEGASRQRQRRDCREHQRAGVGVTHGDRLPDGEIRHQSSSGPMRSTRGGRRMERATLRKS